MNNRDNSINDSSFRKLLNNDNYYRHIFKKTEKIISVVFYILNNVDIDKKSETLVSNIASKAHFAHENALRTLEVKLMSSKEVLEQFAQSLVGLDSTLRVASASGFITPEVLSVIVNEIDAVLRGLRTYIQSNTPSDDLMFSGGYPSVFSSEVAPASAVRERKKTAPSEATEAKAASTQNDRRERIKTILEAKKEATIKDISEIITDVSEKTIQRELNAMIEENLVKRQGERRWSKYSIF
jgi:DNA-binding transcriptional ArsR family regulator